MKPSTIVFIALLVLALFVLLIGGQNSKNSGTPETSNVTMENDLQVIEITAKGGYSPQVTQAKANTPTELRMITDNSFDCSSAVSIPSLGYSEYLPFSGVTSVEIPQQDTGTTLQGLCSMGMYRFEIQFVE